MLADWSYAPSVVRGEELPRRGPCAFGDIGAVSFVRLSVQLTRPVSLPRPGLGRVPVCPCDHVVHVKISERVDEWADYFVARPRGDLEAAGSRGDRGATGRRERETTRRLRPIASLTTHKSPGDTAEALERPLSSRRRRGSPRGCPRCSTGNLPRRGGGRNGMENPRGGSSRRPAKCYA